MKCLKKYNINAIYIYVNVIKTHIIQNKIVSCMKTKCVK